MVMAGMSSFVPLLSGLSFILLIPLDSPAQPSPAQRGQSEWCKPICSATVLDCQSAIRILHPFALLNPYPFFLFVSVVVQWLLEIRELFEFSVKNVNPFK